eukprot:CAMPEP_0116885480 /NCGR_PEP_ID=MMETSP0463-20121206/18837_1 /TAXON_ID=181622 /ORGANISM="Strombidinopsis sp, Strain SopsisLIS2011" /LENGTH=136 /DNA_ID=CAMNT_0004543957 /DNA_START=350 /DNA_END=760 /DNA_ORIENTATION=+
MISKKDVDDYLMYSFVETNFDMNLRELEPFEPPKILGDVFEAVIGAIFEDGGLESVVRAFKHILSPIVLFVAKFSKVLLKEAKESFLIKSMTEYMMRPKYRMQSETEVKTVKSRSSKTGPTTQSLMYTCEILFRNG